MFGLNRERLLFPSVTSLPRTIAYPQDDPPDHFFGGPSHSDL